MNALQHIQKELKCPKNQYNSFGKYAFRNAEGILEAVKPFLPDLNAELTLSDGLELVGNMVFVVGIATFKDYKNNITWVVKGYAKHDEELKGMQGMQITGAASSYARKYALNGLFLIDDTKDADATNDHGKGEKDQPKTPAAKLVSKPTKTAEPIKKEWLNKGTKEWASAVDRVKTGATTVENVKAFFLISKDNEAQLIKETQPQNI